MSTKKSFSDFIFATQVATGSIIILCSVCLSLEALGLSFNLFTAVSPILALIILVGIFRLRGNLILYILLFLVANIPAWWWWKFVYNDLFVCQGVGCGQSTMWLTLFGGFPILILGEWIVGFVGLIMSIAASCLYFALSNRHPENRRKTPLTTTSATTVSPLLPARTNNADSVHPVLIEQTLKPLFSTTQIIPLYDAILSNNTDSVRAALAAHPEHLNTAYAQNGNTPLHVAALNGYAEIVRLLLEQPGIDKTRKNNEGKTALDLAQEKGFTEIADLLKK